LERNSATWQLIGIAWRVRQVGWSQLSNELGKRSCEPTPMIFTDVMREFFHLSKNIHQVKKWQSKKLSKK
jgi:hypothetical protein